MTTFLVILILVLVAVTLWQLTKIFQLTQGSTESSDIANDKDNQLNGILSMFLLIFIYVGTIYSFYAWGDVLLPKSSSVHGVFYDNLMWITMAILFVVQTITQGLLFYFSYKYRGKKGNKAEFIGGNTKLEIIWTAIPMVVLAVLIVFGLKAWTEIMDINNDNEEALVVELYAQQFNWKVRYPGKDDVLGEANVRFLLDFDGKNVVGINPNDPYGSDDVITQVLHLPVDREIIFKMRSQDVLHSAYMPHFRAQMNCVPGMITQFAFTPSVTTVEAREQPDIVEKVKRINKIRAKKSKELQAKGEDPLKPYEFDYILLCNKICGASHYNMQIPIIVETQEEYQAWISQQPTFAQTIQ